MYIGYCIHGQWQDHHIYKVTNRTKEVIKAISKRENHWFYAVNLTLSEECLLENKANVNHHSLEGNIGL